MQVYIGNKTETLLDSLLYVLQHQSALGYSAHPLQPTYIVVQNRGMRHWLSMQMAQQHGIAMNYQFPMVTELSWKILQQVLPDNQRDNSYRCDVMSWRLFELLPSLQQHPELAEVQRFLRHDPSQLKRFQLACELADLLEQYMVFRPQMIQRWQQGDIDHWQGYVWQQLQLEGKPNLADKLHQAIATLHRGDFKAPPSFQQPIYIFGLTHMAPIWLELLQALSLHRPVHLFYLSPCNEYWGDLLTDKRQARQRAQWIRSDKSPGELYSQAGHPLLAAWGWIGQEFVNQLYQKPIQDVDLFDRDFAPASTVLQQLQQDIMTLTDRRDQPLSLTPDQSLTIHSTHSRVREVQALHDWLLAQCDQDATLTPKDILVMCPSIEDYAPFIESVFSPYNQSHSAEPILPCSIADRTLLHSDPLINAYKQWLFLPDSRFSVTDIIEQLAVPAVQRRFRLNDEEISQLQHWLAEVAIHWGLNKQHKARLQLPEQQHYTWQQGLTRLLYGLCLPDTEQYYQGYLSCPLVEGSDAETLGKLIDFLSQLQASSRALQQPKTMAEWQAELKSWTERLYRTDHDDINSVLAIHKAIDTLANHYHEAGASSPVSLAVIRDSLMEAFNEAVEGQHFLTGQVTFCSMLPMRSIPFKIIAVLGLNAGEFPRFKASQNFDLMANGPRHSGDRSRKLEDRYLFLEAVLAARQALFLSYCGRSVKDNSVLQASLVLTELLANLQQAYQLSPAQLITQHPLQPFSASLFQPDAPKSFNQRWLRLLQPPKAAAPLQLEPFALPDVLSLDQLLRLLDNPARAFAQQRLNIRLEAQASLLSDDEPFAVDGLNGYRYQQDYLNSYLSEQADACQLTQQKALDRGHFGQTPRSIQVLDTLSDSTQQFMETVQQQSGLGAAQLQHAHHQQLPFSIGQHTLHLTCDLTGEIRDDGFTLVQFAPVKYQPRRLLKLWLYHLFACACYNRAGQSYAIYKSNKPQSPFTLLQCHNPIAPTQAQAMLKQLIQFYQHCLSQLTLAPPELLLPALLQKTPIEPRHINNYWFGDAHQNSPQQGCRYHQLFWPEAPQHDDAHWQQGQQLYQDLLQLFPNSEQADL